MQRNCCSDIPLNWPLKKCQTQVDSDIAIQSALTPEIHNDESAVYIYSLHTGGNLP